MAWSDTQIFLVGGLFDVPWPHLVWDCRRYAAGDAGHEGSVRIGYLNPRGRNIFRGVEACSMILRDLMDSALRADPTSMFVVFDATALVWEWLGAAIQRSVLRESDQATLRPGQFG